MGDPIDRLGRIDRSSRRKAELQRMSPSLLPWIALLLASAPAVATMPAAKGGGVPLRAHILEMDSFRWRVDLLDRLEYIGLGDSHTVWTADAATLMRLVA